LRHGLHTNRRRPVRVWTHRFSGLWFRCQHPAMDMPVVRFAWSVFDHGPSMDPTDAGWVQPLPCGRSITRSRGSTEREACHSSLPVGNPAPSGDSPCIHVGCPFSANSAARRAFLLFRSTWTRLCSLAFCASCWETHFIGKRTRSSERGTHLTPWAIVCRCSAPEKCKRTQRSCWLHWNLCTANLASLLATIRGPWGWPHLPWRRGLVRALASR
jgi:hypothetical protein